MTIAQMECFLAVAKCLNMSEAARRFNLTQPTLSRQIIAMERELSFQLFYRGKKGLQLTPAGRRLAERFQVILKDYWDALERAKIDNLGITGELNIGVLDDHKMGDFFPEILEEAKRNYPHLQINVQCRDFSGLIEGLHDSSLQLVFTLEFDMKGRSGVKYLPVEEVENDLVVHIANPKASLLNPSLADFKEETFLITAPEDSENAMARLTASCHEAGFNPQCKFAPSQHQMTIWMEANYGVAVLSQKSNLYGNPNLCFIPLPEVHSTSFVVAWRDSDIDPKVLVGLELVKRVCGISDAEHGR